MDHEIMAVIEAEHRKYVKNENPMTPEDILEVLYNAEEVHTQSLGKSRWWENQFRVVRIGDRLIGFVDAVTTGDENARDKGWEFSPKTLCEVEEKERTEVVKFYVKKAESVPAQ